MPDFLLEIGTEEIPARMIEEAVAALQASVRTLLIQEDLSTFTEHPEDNGRVFSTPRRLAVYFSEVRRQQPDRCEKILGPAVKIAYKEGVPTAPAEAFAKKVGLPLDRIGRMTTPKGEYLAAEITRPGRATVDLLAELLPSEISGIPWPKSMYWNEPTLRFARPLRWIVALLDEQIIPLEFAGIRAGNVSRGHRIIGQESVQISHPRLYREILKESKVLAVPDSDNTNDNETREQKIRKALDAATRTIPGARWREDTELLNTVVNLTEFPSAILGRFDPAFLALPSEVLVTVMRDHQKYFAIEDAGGKLLPHFLAVLNTDGDPDGLIRHGNERVLRARFNDARFFWQTDQKHSLLDRIKMLKNVTFQKDLGSYYEKTMRVQRLASWIAETIKQSGQEIRPGVIHKAALLAKTDLTTELVKEFTELQGIVGGLYVRVQQLDSDLPESTRFAIADAIYDHYKPESMDDDVPRTTEGAVLSIADKADSIAGMFALGLQPTGSKDPFALRRQANGVVRVIAHHKLNLPLDLLSKRALEAYSGSDAEKKFTAIAKTGSSETNGVQGRTNEFFRERLEFYLKESGFAYDVVNATLAAGANDVVDVLARAEAVAKARPSADFESISSAFKRMKNILRQASETGKHPAKTLDPSALKEAAEKELANQIPAAAAAVQTLRTQKQYAQALQEISRLRPQIDTFFDKVMVMVEDERLRSNRLALLSTLLREFSTIADFSEIVTETKA